VQRGLLPGDDARAMGQWAHGGGFSVDGSVRIEAADRAGRERLLRYGARPPFALDRLRELGAERLLYEGTKPGPGGNGPLLLTPLELLDRLAALVPRRRASIGTAASVLVRTAAHRKFRAQPLTAAPGRSETHAVPISTTAIAAEQSFIAVKRQTVPDPNRPLERRPKSLAVCEQSGSAIARTGFLPPPPQAGSRPRASEKSKGTVHALRIDRAGSAAQVQIRTPPCGGVRVKTSG
jgi:hypothetical protein